MRGAGDADGRCSDGSRRSDLYAGHHLSIGYGANCSKGFEPMAQWLQRSVPFPGITERIQEKFRQWFLNHRAPREIALFERTGDGMQTKYFCSRRPHLRLLNCWVVNGPLPSYPKPRMVASSRTRHCFQRLRTANAYREASGQSINLQTTPPGLSARRGVRWRGGHLYTRNRLADDPNFPCSGMRRHGRAVQYGEGQSASAKTEGSCPIGAPG